MLLRAGGQFPHPEAHGPDGRRHQPQRAPGHRRGVSRDRFTRDRRDGPRRLRRGLCDAPAVEGITRHSRVRPDAAIGIAFSTLFAVGVVLVAVFADRVDLDQDCVLNGELPMIPLEPPVHLGSLSLGPPPLVRLAGLLVGSVLMLALFYKELLLTSFDPGLAAALGLPVRAVHHGLMLWLALAVVASFEAVGAILVIALLILPGATAALLTERMVPRLVLGVVHAALSAIGGMHLSVALDCSPAGASVVAGGAWFTLAWLFSPTAGWVPRWWRSRGAA
ncbi:MAG: metal ABC transporter permease [Verrucomicrobiota bacterium]